MLEAVWVGPEGGLQSDRALRGDRAGVPPMNVGRSHQANARMPMRGVVPSKEGLAVSPRILDTAEALGELGSIFQGLELRLGIRIVIGHVRATMRLGDRQIDQQGGHRL